jgi:hypothetical protein
MTAWEAAELAGIDMSLIDVSLGYSYDKRALQHQAALELASELERAGHQLDEETELARPMDMAARAQYFALKAAGASSFCNCFWNIAGPTQL